MKRARLNYLQNKQGELEKVIGAYREYIHKFWTGSEDSYNSRLGYCFKELLAEEETLRKVIARCIKELLEQDRENRIRRMRGEVEEYDKNSPSILHNSSVSEKPAKEAR